jgi:hypothetical protein
MLFAYEEMDNYTEANQKGGGDRFGQMCNSCTKSVRNFQLRSAFKEMEISRYAERLI